jgi:hypothetical protein
MWPFNGEDKSPRLGVLSPLDVEIHDSVGDWTHFGRVEMFKKDVAKEKGSIFFYRILTKYREDERVIVTTQDFIHIADQIPYTQTRKGKGRLFQIFLLTFLGIYGLTLWMMGVMIQAGPSIVFYQSQVTGLEMDVADVAIAFASIAGSWAWAARYHHYVSDWEIQPLRINSLKGSTDFYILTNSSKAPVWEEMLKLKDIATVDINKLVDAVRQFEKGEIDRLQEANEFYADQLQVTQVAAYGAKQTSLEAALMTRTERVKERQDRVKQVFIIASACAVTFIAAFFIFVVG